MVALRRMARRATLPKVILGWIAIFAFVICHTVAAREVEDFDAGWEFHLGDLPEVAAAAGGDHPWRKVVLPHDWSIEGPFNRENQGGAAFGYLPGGVGWYRKCFHVPASARGKKVFLQFDGIYQNSRVWVNGVLLGQRGYGFIGFEYDLTPHLNHESGNMIVVRAENVDQPNCRWYSGSGIYRHVRLTTADPLHLGQWGVSVVTPEVRPGKARVKVCARIENHGGSTREFSLETRILDHGKRQVACKVTSEKLSAGESREFTRELVVDNPRLWSPDSPDLYLAVTRLLENDTAVDETTTPFGIRTIRYDKDAGFMLNGKRMKMKGVNLHQDGGSVGAAVPVGIWERRFRTLKEIGCNAIRCSHNPPSPEFLDLCDRMGFLVIDEAFDKWQYENARYFAKDWKRDLLAMLERDRNHPSIVLWSVGNENGGIWEKRQFDTYSMLADLVHRVEPTRPVTAALRPFAPPKDLPTMDGLIARLVPMVGVMDVACLNYQEHLYEDLRKAKPDLVIIGSESLRYYRGEGVKYKSTNDQNPWFDVEKHDYVAGQFLWTGIDYLGESEGWPAKGKANSLMETTGFRKDCSYWHQSAWSEKPMVHIAVFDEATEDYPQKKFWDWPKIRSHWNFPGKSGEVMRLVTYSNCESVELLLNGKSLGKKKPADFKNRSVMWDVVYEPGELKAVGMNGENPVACWSLKTAGPPARVKLVPDKRQLRPDGNDVVHVEVRIEDENGVLVPDAKVPLSFALEGAGNLIGLDNGDLRSNESYKGTSRTTWRGRCLAIVQAARSAGDASLRVTASGFPEASVKWRVAGDGPDAARSCR